MQTAQSKIKNILIFLSIISILPIIGYFSTKIFAAGQTNVLGMAQVSTTGNFIYFNSPTYNANVVISDPDPDNEDKRQITGFAWSEDLGWIKFTDGETPGVFVTSSNGDITGQAYAINSGGTLDFDVANGNATIDSQTGKFTGFVWSDDLGWIDFGTDDVYIEDTKKPNNPIEIHGYSASDKQLSATSGGSDMYNFTQPYFEWDGAVDVADASGYASGISGYYVYWGPSATAIPSVSGEIQSANNFTAPSISATGTYYLRIQAIDSQENVFTDSIENYTIFEYKADVDNPRNVSYLISPNGAFGSVSDMFFTWPESGDVSSDDGQSGVLGWQYSLNDTESWTGTSHSDKLNIDYLPLTDSTYTYKLSSEKDTPNVSVGDNIVYFRTVDIAGNVSNYVIGGVAYGGQSPKFANGSSVTVTPNVSTSNEFGLSWPQATATDDRSIKMYYYMVNTTPPSSYATLSDNSSLYIPTNGTSVSASMLVGSVKGTNTVYVVVVDDQNGYSQSNVITGTYTLNSSLPDPVKNLTITDSSVKEAELWRASLNWEKPTYEGNGNLLYTIQRSTNGTSWSVAGTTQGLSYSDIVSDSSTYYYKVNASDSTDESKSNPSQSITVEKELKGRYDTPAKLTSAIVIPEVTTRHAKINWTTDRDSDSKVMYGLSTGTYFTEESYTSVQTTDHSLNLNNLQPDTIYYFKAKWTDEDGNTGMSQEVSFRTDPTPKVIDSTIDKVGLDFAMLSFEVEGASKASVLYGKTASYGGLKEVNTSPFKTKYTVILENLSDNTTYNYMIRLVDSEGYSYDSIENHTFVTPPLPKISNVTVEELKGVASPTVIFNWSSNTEITSVVTYLEEGNVSSTVDKVVLKMEKGAHKMNISGLNPQTKYVATIEGVDKLGNKAVSEAIRFTTATDTRPPMVSTVKVESNLLSRSIQGDKSRSAQLIISWDTDEPSTSRVEYGEGSSGAYNNSSQTDFEMRTKHSVIISGLTPSKVYHLNVVSLDTAGNQGNYGPVISITTKASDTVYETVINSVLNIFNFLLPS